MADAEKEMIKKSIADWQAKLDAGTSPFSEDVVKDIIAKLEADLAALDS